MTAARYFGLVMDSKSAINEVSSELKSSELFAVDELTYYIVFGAGTTAGAVQIESAHTSSYSGTWATEGAAVAWVAANRVHKLSITGVSFVSRARISTTIANGTVSVYAIGN